MRSALQRRVLRTQVQVGNPYTRPVARSTVGLQNLGHLRRHLRLALPAALLRRSSLPQRCSWPPLRSQKRGQYSQQKTTQQDLARHNNGLTNSIANAEPTKGRLISLDAFRGLTIAAMMVVNNLGSYSTAYPPLLHAPWHGWTPTDLIFPSFLWIAGVAITLSFARRREKGASAAELLRHTARRAALIFLLGLLLNLFPYFRFETVRVPGVLQRIALAYLGGAAIYLVTGWKARVAALALLGALYSAFMHLYPVPGYGPGHWEPIGNFAQYLDSLWLQGHMWTSSKVWDPEGTWSTLPAIGNVLLGTLAGEVLRRGSAPAAVLRQLLLLAAALVLSGQLVQAAGQPVNKALWTVSFALLTSGLAQAIFALIYWAVEIGKVRFGMHMLAIYGSNAITVYALSSLLAKTLNLLGWRTPLFQTLFAPLGDLAFTGMLFGLAHSLLFFGVAWLLYRRGWMLRF